MLSLNSSPTFGCSDSQSGLISNAMTDGLEINTRTKVMTLNGGGSVMIEEEPIEAVGKLYDHPWHLPKWNQHHASQCKRIYTSNLSIWHSKKISLPMKTSLICRIVTYDLIVGQRGWKSSTRFFAKVITLQIFYNTKFYAFTLLTDMNKNAKSLKTFEK